MVTRCDPAKDIIIIPGAFGHELNPVVKDNLAAKMGFDCMYPVPKPESYTLVSFQDVDIGKYDIGWLPGIWRLPRQALCFGSAISPHRLMANRRLSAAGRL